MTLIPCDVEMLTSTDLVRIKEDLLCRLQSVEPTQEHVLAHWDDLDDFAKARLATQIDEVDFDLLSDIESVRALKQDLDGFLVPPPVITREQQLADCQAIATGKRCLADGRVGIALVAGGMGTRLGFEQPKGMFPIGPVSGNTLFQILIERIVALGRQFGVRIPLYLMTSQETHQATIDFLRDHDSFDLHPDDLRIFCQGTLPAINAHTRQLLLAGPGELATCPDGHGGFVDAARKAGSLKEMAQRGIDVLFYGQIDNPLLPLADPTVMGHHVLANADITTLIVKRSSPTEKVGMLVSCKDRIWVVEYSELPESIAMATDNIGKPLFWAGNMGVHVFRVDFLTRIADRPDALPIHPCRKRVDHLDLHQNDRQSCEPNAIKYERFIFDLMHHTNRSVLVEADRASTFAPVKNPDSMASDTPATARAAMVALHRKWIRNARTAVAPGVPVEISPLFAVNEADLVGKPLPAFIQQPTYLK